MTDQSRPLSRWSTSMSITTKLTGCTNQTIPLTHVRKKLFRQSGNTQKTFAQRMTKSKHDIEELFQLYYSNDVKFDTFHRQIVTGTRISAERTPPLPQNNLTSNSTNMFNSKHCVSREQMNTANVDGNERTTTKSAPIKRTVQIRTENNGTVNSPVFFNPSPSTTILIPSKQSITPSSTQQEELCDSSLVKSVAFLEEISNEIQENTKTNKNKPNNSPRSKSSLVMIPPAPPPPSLLAMSNSNSTNTRKDPTVLSHTSFSTMNSVQPQLPNSLPTVVTGSAVVVRQRSSTKPSWSNQRVKSGIITRTTNSSSSQSATRTRSPSISTRLSTHPDMPEVPVYIGAQRIVSIPSKCSRYVLVTFPEAPLRYNAPSYVERLLLPERFPTLFQNIVQSYDHHFTSTPHHGNPQ